MKGLNKKFGAFGNINILGNDDEFLKLASEAGCVSWAVGFESVCSDSLAEMGKKTNKVHEYLSAIKKVHDHGMIITGFFVFGFDNDTLNIFEKTDEFVSKSDIDSPFGQILTPLPGTPLYERFQKENRILTKDWSRYTTTSVVFKPKNMNPQELLENTQELFYRWYDTPKVIFRTIKSLKYGFYPFIDRISANTIFKYSRFS